MSLICDYSIFHGGDIAKEVLPKARGLGKSQNEG